MVVGPFDRRTFLRIAGWTSTGVALSSTISCKPGGPVERPDVLIICSDQHQAAKMGHRGGTVVATPHLDRLAAEGAQFTRAHCNYPLCGPSRMSMMTGRYVYEIGTWLNGTRLPAGARTWADALATAGYETSAYGKTGAVGTTEDFGFHDLRTRFRHPVYLPWPFDSPFDYRLRGAVYDSWWLRDGPQTREDGLKRLIERGVIARPEGLHFGGDVTRETGYYDEDREATDLTLDFLRARARRPGAGGWIHFLGLTMPHWPYIGPRKYMELYDPAEVELPQTYGQPADDLHPALREFKAARPHDMSERRYREYAAAYFGLLTCMDEMIGEVLAELDRTGLSDRTVVLYTSDHGESLGAHGLFGKQTPYRESVEVPLLVRGPGIAPGQRIDTPVSLVDLFPTLLDLAGAEGPREVSGASLAPAILGRGVCRPDGVMAEHHAGHVRRDWFLLARGPLRYTHYVGERPSLFDLTDDPHELRDLALDPSRAGVVAELEAALRSRIDPQAVALGAKRDLGLIGPLGEDYTETLTHAELVEGRSGGRFPPRFRSRMVP